MAECSWEKFFMAPVDQGVVEKVIFGIDEVPGVIDRQMIVDCFLEDSSPEYKQEHRAEDLPFEEVTTLNLENKNILKIDHVWMLENLTALSLAHNAIERIENLDELKNLMELNLAYNNITVIEGLEGLKKLEVLMVYGNKIKSVSGLLAQEHSLRILSLANNEIKDASCVSYLMRFKKLVSLNIDGNPCADKALLERVCVYLTGLVYYNNLYVTDEQRKDARLVLEAELKEKADLEESRERYMKKLLAHKRKLDFCRKAFVEGLEKNEFYHKLFQKDVDGRSFRDDTDKFDDIYERLRATCFNVCVKIYEAGAQNIVRRNKEVMQFKTDTAANALTGQKKLTQATAKISTKLNVLIERTKNYFKGPMTKQLKRDITSLKMWLRGLEMLREFVSNFLDDEWFHLIAVEMKNFEKNEETINAYDRGLAEVITVFVEEIQSQFTRLRDAENDCYDEVATQLIKLMNESYQRGDLEKLPQSYQDRMVDKETLNNAIDASHDFHLLAIDMKEDAIISKLKMWHKQQTGDLMKNEMLRNRKAVIQIHKYIDNQKKEFEQQICGILNLFKFLEPDENFEENLDAIIKEWLSSKSMDFVVPKLIISEEEESTSEVPEELKEVFSLPFLDVCIRTFKNN